jgi:hypothetical protein
MFSRHLLYTFGMQILSATCLCDAACFAVLFFREGKNVGLQCGKKPPSFNSVSIHVEAQGQIIAPRVDIKSLRGIQWRSDQRF